MNKHSVGPWRRDGTEIVDARGEEVCSLDYVTGDLEKRDADIDLISAAPEMLEALKLGLKYLETKRGADDLGDPDRFAFAQALGFALDNATGGAK